MPNDRSLIESALRGDGDALSRVRERRDKGFLSGRSLERLADAEKVISRVERDQLRVAREQARQKREQIQDAARAERAEKAENRAQATIMNEQAVAWFTDKSGRRIPITAPSGGRMKQYDKKSGTVFDEGTGKAYKNEGDGNIREIDPDEDGKIVKKNGHVYSAVPGMKWKWLGLDKDAASRPDKRVVRDTAARTSELKEKSSLAGKDLSIAKADLELSSKQLRDVERKLAEYTITDEERKKLEAEKEDLTGVVAAKTERKAQAVLEVQREQAELKSWGEEKKKILADSVKERQAMAFDAEAANAQKELKAGLRAEQAVRTQGVISDLTPLMLESAGLSVETITPTGPGLMEAYAEQSGRRTEALAEAAKANAKNLADALSTPSHVNAWTQAAMKPRSDAALAKVKATASFPLHPDIAKATGYKFESPDWSTPEALERQKTAKLIGQDAIRVPEGYKLEDGILYAPPQSVGNWEAPAERLGRFKFDQYGVGYIELDDGARSPSFEATDYYRSMPEYTARPEGFFDEFLAQAKNDPSFKDALAQRGASDLADDAWRDRRWSAEQLSDTIEQWQTANEAGRAALIAEIDPRQADIEEGKRFLDARWLFEQGMLSKQDARLLENAAYGTDPGYSAMPDDFDAWVKDSKSEAAMAYKAKLALRDTFTPTSRVPSFWASAVDLAVKSVPGGVAPVKLLQKELDRQVAAELYGAKEAFIAEYKQKNAHRIDWDEPSFVAARDKLTGDESTIGWAQNSLNQQLQNAFGSTLGMLLNAGALADDSIAQAFGGHFLTDEQRTLIGAQTQQAVQNMARAAIDRKPDSFVQAMLMASPGAYLWNMGGVRDKVWSGEVGGRIHKKTSELYDYINSGKTDEAGFKERAAALAADLEEYHSDKLRSPVLDSLLGMTNTRRSFENDMLDPRSGMFRALAAYVQTGAKSYWSAFEGSVFNTAYEQEIQNMAANYASNHGLIAESSFFGPFQQAFIGGTVAPFTEVIVEAGSDLTGVFGGKLLTMGRYLSKAGRAGRIANSIGRELSRFDELAMAWDKFGRATAAHGLPLTGLQKARNIGVTAGKQMLASGIPEGIEEMIGAFGDSGATFGDSLAQGFGGAIGGIGLSVIHAPIGAGMAGVQIARYKAAQNKALKKFVADYNSQNPGSSITFEQAKKAQNLQNVSEVRDVMGRMATAFNRLKELENEAKGLPPLVDYIDGKGGVHKETPNPRLTEITDEVSQIKDQIAAAALDMDTINERSLLAVREIEGLPEDQRAVVEATLTHSSGGTLTPVALQTLQDAGAYQGPDGRLILPDALREQIAVAAPMSAKTYLSTTEADQYAESEQAANVSPPALPEKEAKQEADKPKPEPVKKKAAAKAEPEAASPASPEQNNATTTPQTPAPSKGQKQWQAELSYTPKGGGPRVTARHTINAKTNAAAEKGFRARAKALARIAEGPVGVGSATQVSESQGSSTAERLTHKGQGEAGSTPAPATPEASQQQAPVEKPKAAKESSKPSESKPASLNSVFSEPATGKAVVRMLRVAVPEALSGKLPVRVVVTDRIYANSNRTKLVSAEQVAAMPKAEKNKFKPYDTGGMAFHANTIFVDRAALVLNVKDAAPALRRDIIRATWREEMRHAATYNVRDAEQLKSDWQALPEEAQRRVVMSYHAVELSQNGGNWRAAAKTMPDATLGMEFWAMYLSAKSEGATTAQVDMARIVDALAVKDKGLAARIAEVLGDIVRWMRDELLGTLDADTRAEFEAAADSIEQEYNRMNALAGEAEEGSVKRIDDFAAESAAPATEDQAKAARLKAALDAMNAFMPKADDSNLGGAAASAAKPSAESLAEDAAWKKTVAEYYENPSRREMLPVGRVPAVLRAVGVSDAPMVMPPSVIHKVTKGKHTLTREMVEQIPAALRDPIMVFDSATEADAVTALTEIRHEGRNVIAAIHLDRPAPNKLANVVVSLYEKSPHAIQQWIKDGLLRYSHQQKTRAYFLSARLQLPREGSKAGNKTLLTEADVVNRGTVAASATKPDADIIPQNNAFIPADNTRQWTPQALRFAVQSAAAAFGYKIVDTGIDIGIHDRYGKTVNLGTQLYDKLVPGSEVGQWLDKIGHSPFASEIAGKISHPGVHRVWFGHDFATNLGGVVDKFGIGAIPDYIGQLAKDSLTKSGIPFPGVELLVRGGAVSDRVATDWLSTNIGEVFGGGVAFFGTYRLLRATQKGTLTRPRVIFATIGVGIKLAAGVATAQPFLILSGLADAAILVTNLKDVRAAFQKAADVAKERPARPIVRPPEAATQAAAAAKHDITASPEAVAAMSNLMDALWENGHNTPEAVAAVLEQRFPGRITPKALWQIWANGSMTDPESAPSGQEWGKILEGARSGKAESGNAEKPKEKARAPRQPEWVNFSPDTGTLGVPRSEMPQVPSESRGALVNFLESKGITATTETVSADSLKPTQAEYSPKKVKKAESLIGGTQRKLLVSADGHLLDGHHQWLASRGRDVEIMRLSVPVREALAAIAELPSTEGGHNAATHADVPTSVAPPAEGATAGMPQFRAARSILAVIKDGRAMDWRELFALTDAAWGGTMADGTYTVKDAYDAMELAVNMWLDGLSPQVPEEEARRQIGRLQDLLAKLPTQSKRTAESDAMQQFSTPPTLAYLANWVANIVPGDVMLEPSAGIGGLAVFARNAGATVIANELSARRREFLQALGFPHVFGENAEKLNHILGPKWRSGELPRPTVTVMNPPFSNAAKSGKRGDTKIGADHVLAALASMEEGGRLVAIVGEGMAFDAPTFRTWWQSVAKKYSVRANVWLDGKNYAKYGTTFSNRLLVIDKVAPVEGVGLSRVVTGEVDDLADATTILEGVRNERERESSIQGSPAEQGGGGIDAEVRNDAGTRGRRGQSDDAGVGTDVERGGQDAEQLLGRDGRREAGESGESGRSEGDSGNSGRSVAARGTGRREESGGSRKDASGRTVRGSGGASSGRSPVAEQSGVTVEKADDAARREIVNEDDIFAVYQPAKLRISGAKAHPAPLVESAAMASVLPPDVTYTPNLPREVVEKGKLSLAQLENVAYAGQAHSATLPNGERRGYFIGDGTGVGKGRQIAGIVLDNWRQGRKKAVWISKTPGLLKDAQRDVKAVGGMDEKQMFNLGAAKIKDSITNPEGVAFTSYSTLSSGHSPILNEEDVEQFWKDIGSNETRLGQLARWLGRDFDGVIAFDESHKAGNAIAVRGKRGVKQPSLTGIAVLDLQRLLPNARVVYVSATGATEVENLSYADRLGIWGKGTPFATKQDFFNQIRVGGVSAMEIVARDLKAMGSYLARSISYKDVKFDRITHNLSPEQEATYNKIADAWQVVLANIDHALEATNGANNSRAVQASVGQFWGAQQRFFNQLLTSLQLPSMFEDMDKQLAEGKSVVLQLVNTNEASEKRAVEKARRETEDKGDNASIEGLDLSPRDILLQFIEKSFPTVAYEEVADESNPERTVWREVKDSAGNLVHSEEALAAKRNLQLELATLPVPDGVLNQILNRYGTKDVAEVTGRGMRVVTQKDKNGREKTVVEKRSSSVRRVEADEFNEGKRRILIFSDAGGTGFSFHAGKDFKNQQQRIHYLVQAGWRADNALQGFGRTHRTAQILAPIYKLLETNIRGHRRFIASIARRLAQLGALTQGERSSAGQGMFSEADNLENEYAAGALKRLVFDLFANRDVGDFTFEEFGDFAFEKFAQGLGYVSTRNGEPVNRLLDSQTGQLDEEKIPTIQQFLNRILALPIDRQNALFDMFFERMERRIEAAKAEGTYDEGTQVYKAKRIEKESDEVVADMTNGSAPTRLVTVKAFDDAVLTPFENAERGGDVVWARNRKSGSIYALRDGGYRTDTATGEVYSTWRRVGVSGNDAVNKSAVSLNPGEMIDGKLVGAGNYEALEREQAEKLWNEEVANHPKETEREATFLVGAMLPVWDRIGLKRTRIFRFATNEGEQFIGVEVPKGEVPGLRARMGARNTITPQTAFGMVRDEGSRMELANGWTMERRLVSGDRRVEIGGLNYAQARTFEKDFGGVIEVIAFKPRMFVPNEAAMAAIMSQSPISKIDGEAVGEGGGGAAASAKKPGSVDDKASAEYNGDDGRQVGFIYVGGRNSIGSRYRGPGGIRELAAATSGNFGGNEGAGEADESLAGRFRRLREIVDGAKLNIALPFFKRLVNAQTEFAEPGAEHSVYGDERSNRIIKVTHPDYTGDGTVGAKGSAGDYFTSLHLSSVVLKMPARFEGLVRTGEEGVKLPQIVISQPWIRGRKATTKEIAKDLRERGFVPKEARKDVNIWTHIKGVVDVYDAVPSNVLRDERGKLHYIDVDVIARKPVPEIEAVFAKAESIVAASAAKPVAATATTEDGNVQALVSDNMGLAYHFAERYSNIPGMDFDDRLQEARLGLVKAAEAFDPSRGTPFGAFASRIIKNQLNASFRRYAKTSRHETAELDAPIGGEEGAASAKDNLRAAEAPQTSAEDRRAAAEALDKIPVRPRRIWQALSEGRSLRDIAAEEGLSQEGVRKIANATKNTLRAELRKRGIESVDDVFPANREAFPDRKHGTTAETEDENAEPVVAASAAKVAAQASDEMARIEIEGQKAAEFRTTAKKPQNTGRAALASDAGEFYAKWFRGRFDKVDFYVPGAKDIILDYRRNAALATAAVNGMMRMMRDDITKSFGYPKFWDKNKKRLQSFLDEILPVAARLEVAELDDEGNFVFKDFNMRSGMISSAKVRASGLRPGDDMATDRGIFTIGPEVEGGRNLLLKYMPAAVQQKIHEAFHEKYPEAAHYLDRWIMPGMDAARFSAPNGSFLIDFNRYALRDAFNQWPQEMRDLYGLDAFRDIPYVEGYTPDVAEAKTIGNMIGSLLRLFKSGARQFKAGEARESGNIKNLFDGFSVRALEAHREKIRVETRAQLIEKAAVPAVNIPVDSRDDFVDLDKTFAKLLEAVEIGRRLNPNAFPNLSAALAPKDKQAMARILGDAYRLRGRRLVIHKEVERELMLGAARQITNNSLTKILGGLIERYNAGLLALPFTALVNWASNEIIKTVRLGNRLNHAIVSMAGGEMRDAKIAALEFGYLLRGFISDRFPQRQMDRIEGIVPRELFEDQTGLEAMDIDPTLTIRQQLGRLNLGGALLQAYGYGEIDIHAKQQMAYAAYRAHGEVAWREAKKAGTVAKDTDKRAWLKDWVKNASPGFHRDVHATTVLYLMDYQNVPAWLDASQSNTAMGQILKRALIPFAKWPYNMARQFKRLTFDAALDTIMAGRSKEQRINGMANLMTMAGLAALGAVISKLDLGGGDDDEPIIGSAIDEEGELLASGFRTANRLNVSRLMRAIFAHGLMHDVDFTVTDGSGESKDLWWRYRNYPYLKEGILLGLVLTGRKARALDQLSEISDEYVSFGILSKLVWPSKFDDRKSLAWRGAEVALDLTTSGVAPVPWRQFAVNMADPVARKYNKSESIGYEAGFTDALRANIPGLSKGLPSTGHRKPVAFAPFSAKEWFDGKKREVEKSSMPPNEKRSTLARLSAEARELHMDIPSQREAFARVGLPVEKMDARKTSVAPSARRILALEKLGIGAESIGVTPKGQIVVPDPATVNYRPRGLQALRAFGGLNVIAVPRGKKK